MVDSNLLAVDLTTDCRDCRRSVWTPRDEEDIAIDILRDLLADERCAITKAEMVGDAEMFGGEVNGQLLCWCSGVRVEIFFVRLHPGKGRAGSRW